MDCFIEIVSDPQTAEPENERLAWIGTRVSADKVWLPAGSWASKIFLNRRELFYFVNIDQLISALMEVGKTSAALFWIERRRIFGSPSDVIQLPALACRETQ